MSKERELLARIVNENMAQYYFNSLVQDIKELLEQPEQEPLSDESYYRHIKEHKQQCEDDFINHQYREDDE